MKPPAELRWVTPTTAHNRTSPPVQTALVQTNRTNLHLYSQLKHMHHLTICTRTHTY